MKPPLAGATLLRTALLLTALFTTQAFSQIGGETTYSFLRLTWSAKAAALGGSVVSLVNDDYSLLTSNPSLAAGSPTGNIMLGYTGYLAGISYGHAHTSFSYGEKTTLAGGIKWLSYGSFIEADAAGNITGSFKAAEYALNMIVSRTIDSSFNVAVNIKPVLSHLDSYSSLGIAFDAGVSWISDNRLLSAGATIRNAGIQITSYTGQQREKLPLEIEAGVSKKLLHAPLRFTITLRNLQRFNLTHNYDSGGGQTLTGSSDNNKSDLVENMLRHIVVGAELIPHRNFWAGVGYNHHRGRELQVEAAGVPAGFSWGFGVRISGFTIGFSRATYHLAGASNQFGVSFVPSQLITRGANR